MRLDGRLVLAGYGVALLLILVPLIETVLTVWPFRFGDVAWRFGAAGLVTRAMLTPLFGALLCIGLAIALGHRGVLRSILVLCGLAALVLIASSPLFVLDALELRRRVQHDLTPGFDVAAFQAFTKLLLFGGVGFLFVLGGWSTTRARAPLPSPEAKHRDAGAVLLVRGRTSVVDS